MCSTTLLLHNAAPFGWCRWVVSQVLEAVRQTWQAIEFAATRLKSDREIAMAAVMQNWTALLDVARSFRADRGVVLAAVRQNGPSLRCVLVALASFPSTFLTSLPTTDRTCLIWWSLVYDLLWHHLLWHPCSGA